jgi:hypothetical protein
LTTTGAVSTGAITATTLTASGAASVGSLASTGAVTAKTVAITNPSATTALTINQSLAGNGVVIQSADGIPLSIQSTNTDPVKGGSFKIFDTSLSGDITFNGASDGIFVFNNTSTAVTKATVFSGANFGINVSPAKTFHVNGTVRLQGLPTYANNAAAIAGGLAVGDLFIANVSGEGQLRIVI